MNRPHGAMGGHSIAHGAGGGSRKAQLGDLGEQRRTRVRARRLSGYFVRKPSMRSANLPYGGIRNFRLEKRAW
jgi:hypothetical protein